MKKIYIRVGFTQAQKNELWERWRRDEQMKSIGRELCKPSSSIFNHIRSTGGFTPIPRRRAALTLSLTEREEISRGLVASQSIRSIAACYDGPPQRSAARLPATAGLHATVLRPLTSEHGNRPYGPSPVSWYCISA